MLYTDEDTRAHAHAYAHMQTCKGRALSSCIITWDMDMGLYYQVESEHGVRGGIEFAFMSCTYVRAIAEQFASQGSQVLFRYH